jgi:hypothetical protein
MNTALPPKNANSRPIGPPGHKPANAGGADVDADHALRTVETVEVNEPVADEVRSILDGHIILSRTLVQDAI